MKLDGLSDAFVGRLRVARGDRRAGLGQARGRQRQVADVLAPGAGQVEAVAREDDRQPTTRARRSSRSSSKRDAHPSTRRASDAGLQSTVDTSFAVAIAGLPRGDVLSTNDRYAEVAIRTGVLVCQGTADGQCKLPTRRCRGVAKGLGIAPCRINDSRFPAGGVAGVTYQIGDTVGAISRGKVWVPVEDAVTAGSPAYARHGQRRQHAARAFRSDTDSGNAAAVTGCRYLTSASERPRPRRPQPPAVTREDGDLDGTLKPKYLPSRSADAGETLVIQRSLDHIEQKVTDVLYAEMRALKYVPRDRGHRPRREDVHLRGHGPRGAAAAAAERGRDLPRADVSLTENVGHQSPGASYAYTTRSCARSPWPPRMKAQPRARPGARGTAAQMIARRSTSSSRSATRTTRIKGFLNSSSVTVGAAAGTWSGLTDLQLLAGSSPSRTRSSRCPRRCSRRTLSSSRPRSTSSSRRRPTARRG